MEISLETLEKYLKKDLGELIKDRIYGRNITHYAAVEFQKKLYKLPIGQEIQLAGFFSYADPEFFLEFPPGSGIGITVSGYGLEDYVDGMCLVKGIVRPVMKRMKVVGKQIVAKKIEEDYYPAYDLDIAPLTPRETFGLFRERISARDYLLKALFLSPISSPIVFNRMGGVSSIFDFPSRVGRGKHQTKNMYDLADIILQMVPAWHRTLNSQGFSLAKISRVDSRLGTILRERNIPRPEVGVIYPRIAYDSIREFYEASFMENTIVLQDITPVYAPDFDQFLTEIQWSIMINHAQLRQITPTDLPPGVDLKINDWFNRIQDRDDIFKKHVRLQGLLDKNFQGRRGIILRVMAALARFNESPPTEAHLKECLQLQEALLEEFIYEHGGLIEDYERSVFLQTPFKHIKKLRNAIFDICQSEGGISLARIMDEAQKLNVKRKETYQVLHDLLQEGYLYQPTNDEFYKMT